MATKKMVFDEHYGEIPASLHRAIKRYEVTPAEFQTMEYYDLSFEQMEELITSFSPNGYFNSFNAMNSLGLPSY